MQSHDRGSLLRQSAVALLLFLVAALPFQLWCAEPYADLVIAGARGLTSLAIPKTTLVDTSKGVAAIDRATSLDDFFDDPDQRPQSHGVLAFWSWFAVAALHTTPRRWRLLALGTAAIVGVDVLAVGCNAVAWYRTSLAVMGVATPLAQLVTSLIGTLGVAFSASAMLVAPGLFAILVYPGLHTLVGDPRHPPARRTRWSNRPRSA